MYKWDYNLHMDEKNKSSVSQAFSDFSEKFSRFLKDNPQNEPKIQKSKDTLLQERILEQEKQFVSQICAKYQKYINSEQLLPEQEQLLAAYNLFKAVKEAEKQYGSSQTCIKKDFLYSALCQNSQYTSGTDFIYLRVWLEFAQNIHDLVPQFSANHDGTYSLSFIPSRYATFTVEQKEIYSIILSNFYS